MSLQNSPAPSTSCSAVACQDYVTCQTNMINAIDHFNASYSQYLNYPTNQTYKQQSNQAADAMLVAVQNVTEFIQCNPHIVAPANHPQATYDDILHKRQTLNQQVDILKSMNGAPKGYNASNNMYDEYRISYNTSVYVSILVCLLAVFVIYFYFRSLTTD